MLFMISVGATFWWPNPCIVFSALPWRHCVLHLECCGRNKQCVRCWIGRSSPILQGQSSPRKLGKLGLFIMVGFTTLSLALGVGNAHSLRNSFCSIRHCFRSVVFCSPFRLRKTAYKPIVNFTVGAVPVLIIAAFFNVSSINVVALVLLIGITTSVNSLWEDLADYVQTLTAAQEQFR